MGSGVFFFSSRRRHTRSLRDWSSDVCSSDLAASIVTQAAEATVAFFDALEALSREPGYGWLTGQINIWLRAFRKRQMGNLDPRLAAELADIESPKQEGGKESGRAQLGPKSLDAMDWDELVRIWFFELGGPRLERLDFGPNARTTHDVKELAGTKKALQMAA